MCNLLWGNKICHSKPRFKIRNVFLTHTFDMTWISIIIHRRVLLKHRVTEINTRGYQKVRRLSLLNLNPLRYINEILNFSYPWYFEAIQQIRTSTYHFLINHQCFCKQRCVQAAQPQNMTFSQRKSWAVKSSDINNFLFDFYFTSLD